MLLKKNGNSRFATLETLLTIDNKFFLTSYTFHLLSHVHPYAQHLIHSTFSHKTNVLRKSICMD